MPETSSIKPTLTTTLSAARRVDLAVVILDGKRRISQLDDPALEKVVADARRRHTRQTLKRDLFHTAASGPIPHLLVVNTALASPHAGDEAIRIVTARAIETARDHGLRRVAVLLNGDDGDACVAAATDGIVLGGYRQTTFRSTAPPRHPAVSIVVATACRRAAARTLERHHLVAEQVNRCRELVNEPGATATPARLARIARQICADGGLRCTVLSAEQLKRKGYRGILTVGQGSPNRPCMIVMGYRPPRPSKRHLALVGKGVTFDTGGISLKRAEGMWTMKGDIAGAGAVMHAMAAIAQCKPSIRVTGIIGTAENAIGSQAMRPGDILKAHNGKTILIDNTDAEGRLVLTDALARAGEEKATHIVDLATLTGACVRALGPAVAGVMGNDRRLVQQVIACGSGQGEQFWELPLVPEYAETLKTPGADLKNVGGVAGAITAGLFLEAFVPTGTAWAHLDIAGPAHIDRRWKHYAEGATGFGVKSIVALSEQL